MAEAIAVYGAVVASAAIVWNVFNYTSDKGKLRIDIARSRISRNQTMNPTTLTVTVTDWLDVLAVTASNVGRRPMTIGQCVIENTDDRSQMYMAGGPLRYGQAGFPLDESHKLPKRLSDGESHTYYFPVEGLVEKLPSGVLSRPISAVVSDGTGKKWRSPILRAIVQFIESTNPNAANDSPQGEEEKPI